MNEGFNLDLLQFQDINQASRATGFPYCTLRSPCEKENMTIMRQKDGKVFHLYWSGVCSHCMRSEFPFPVERKFTLASTTRLLQFHSSSQCSAMLVIAWGVKVAQYWFLW